MLSVSQMNIIYEIVLDSNSRDGQPNLRYLSFNFFGNHVIQRLARRIEQLKEVGRPELHTQFIGQVQDSLIDYCKHEFGCRIVQRLIENTIDEVNKTLIGKVLAEYDDLITN